MPDYLEYDAHTNKATYVSDWICKGRRICLYGISVVFTQTADSGLLMSPSIPCSGPLMRLIKSNPEHSAFEFEDGEWEVANYA